MADKICVDSVFFFLLVAAMVLVVIYHYMSMGVKRHQESCPVPTPCPQLQPEEIVEEIRVPVHIRHRREGEVHDIIRQRDHAHLFDPLVEPGRRAPSYMIPPRRVAQWLNIGTRPYDDQPQPIGYLARQGDGQGEDDSKILTLIAVRDYYRRTKYNYWALTPNGIKIQLDTRTDELNTGEVVKIDDLNHDYKVTIYDMDGPRYNPYMHY
jgi:hypothetical protein